MIRLTKYGNKSTRKARVLFVVSYFKANVLFKEMKMKVLCSICVISTFIVGQLSSRPKNYELYQLHSVIKSPRSGVTWWFQFVFAAAAAKAFASHAKPSKLWVFRTNIIQVWRNARDGLSITLTQGHDCGACWHNCVLHDEMSTTHPFSEKCVSYMPLGLIKFWKNSVWKFWCFFLQNFGCFFARSNVPLVNSCITLTS